MLKTILNRNVAKRVAAASIPMPHRQEEHELKQRGQEMIDMKKMKLLALAMLLLSVAPSKAALVISLQELGDDFVVTASGTANTVGMTVEAQNSNFTYSQIYPSKGNVYSWNGDYSRYSLNGDISGYGTDGSLITSGVQAGDTFGVGFNTTTLDRLYLPYNYTSGSQIDGTLTLLNTSFADLGIDPEHLEVLEFNSGPNLDTVTVQVKAIPEPASLSLLVLAGAALLRRRRRR